MSIQIIDRDARPDPFPFFSYGFRPFFLLAGLSAIAFLAPWLAVLHGGPWPSAVVMPMSWHGHEMLFGFVVATVAGFLLTAIPNWTGARPVAGWALAGLAGLWIAGRAASSPYLEPSMVTAVVDLAFLPALGAVVAIPLLRAGKGRNTAFLLLLAVLAMANLLFHLEWLGLAQGTSRAGVALATGVVLMMVTVVGGRIVPSFTQNSLRRRFPDCSIVARPWLEKSVLLSTAAMIPADLLWPDGPIAGAVALAAALAHALRLGRWQGRRTWGEPILWILHAGYAWIVVALALKALHLLGDLSFASAWLHALTVGAFSTMILGVMSRVALGHTGRPLVLARSTVVAYGLLIAAGCVRVAVPALPDGLYLPMVGLAGSLWAAAFLLFLWRYAPILMRARADGQPGC